MQLRVPKRYQSKARRRRGFLKRRSTWLFLFAVLASVAAYFILRNPVPFRAGATNFANNVGNEISQTRSEMFPDAPTATPDVRQDIVECENAYMLGDLNTVMEACQRALVGRPNDVELHHREAYTLVITSSLGQNTDRINEAIEIADLTILANPLAPEGYAVKAMALDWGRRHAEALPYALRALEIDPNHTMAKAHLGNIYRNLGRPELARPLLQEALEDVQNGSVTPETRAQAYRNYGRFLASSADADFDAALEAMQVARQAMPSHTYIAIEMSDIYLAQGQPNQQLEILENALQANPLDISLLSRLGDVYYNQGLTTPATDMYTRCLDRDPNFVNCLSPLGRIQYLTNRNYEIALGHFENAIENGSTNPYDWYLLGRSHYNLQQCQFAGDPLRRGYELLQEDIAADSPSPFVGIEDFVRAFRECGLPAPN
jgi:tetratricopeptide (TPR) repeat protein